MANERVKLEYANAVDLLSYTLREKPDSEVVLELTSKFNKLQDLASATIDELLRIKGIGWAKALQLKACVELGKRIYTLPASAKPVIRCPNDVADLVMTDMRYLDREHFRVLSLNTKNHVLSVETVSIGSLNNTVVHPREVFKSAIRNSAAAIILVHNHPSGDTEPSREDIQVTNRLKETGDLLGIQVFDHLIIGNGKYLSFKEKGLL